MILSKSSLMVSSAGTQAVKGRRRMYIHAIVPDIHLHRQKEQVGQEKLMYVGILLS